MDAAEDQDSSWHSRLFCYTFWGLTHGWARRWKDKKISIIEPMKRTAAGSSAEEEPPKTAAPQGDAEQKAPRKRCKNAMDVVPQILSDG